MDITKVNKDKVVDFIKGLGLPAKIIGVLIIVMIVANLCSRLVPPPNTVAKREEVIVQEEKLKTFLDNNYNPGELIDYGMLKRFNIDSLISNKDYRDSKIPAIFVECEINYQEIKKEAINEYLKKQLDGMD